MSTSSNFSKVKVDASSAFTAVCAYHPWRTLATRAMAGLPFTINPKHLYAGFVPSLAGCHQLFVMSSVHQKLNSKSDNTVAAVTAGTASAITATPCDAWAVRKQASIALATNSMAMIFRGFTPTVFRQMGLALGMFVFPSWMERKVSACTPTAHKEHPTKVHHSLAGGIVAAVVTHYPDTVRVVMQSNQQMKTFQACRVAFSRMMSRAGTTSCAMRIGVLGIAFTVMRWGKEHYPKILNKKEN